MSDSPTPSGPGIGGPPSQIKSMKWSCPETPEQCCSHEKQFSYFFCMSLCVLCCCTLKIEYTDPGGGGDGGNPNSNPGTPQSPGTRDYPTTTATSAGITFTASEYGKAIPIVFGSDLLPGNVFWYSGFEDHTYTSGGAVYGYKTVSFALGICEGVINGVLRIKVGDKLILDQTAHTDSDGLMQANADGFLGGATVDITSADSPLTAMSQSAKATRITIYTGSERQIPEAVMAAKEGYANTPAYRGLAYVLFENFIIENNSVPAITVEVLANTTGLLPRLYYVPPNPNTHFNKLDARAMTYDPSYNMYLTLGQDDGAGTGTPIDGQGYVLIDGDTLEEIRQIEVVETYGLSSSNWLAGKHILTSSGHICSVIPSGNAGLTYIFNGVTGQKDFEMGPGGSISGHSLSTGFAAPSDICIIQARQTSGVPADILCVAGSVSKSVGFAEIDKNNVITMTAVFNGVLYQNATIVCPMKVTSSFATTKPVFADGGAAVGTHVFTFSYNTTTEKTKFSVVRFTVEGPDVDISPVQGAEMVIDFKDLNGQGHNHRLMQVDLDPTDNCFVLQVFANGYASRLIKWSPFTGQIVWNYEAQLDTSGAQRPSGMKQVILNQKYGFFSTDSKIYTVDLKDGSMKAAITDLPAQGLPGITSNRFYVYNAYDNSLAYLSTTANKDFTKVFLDRLNRENVGVANIIKTLLERVGVRDRDIDVNDLSALSLNGYTIMQSKPLRTIFQELAQVFRFDVIESSGKIIYRARGQVSGKTINRKYLADADTDGYFRQTRDADFAAARKINLTYRDLDRDYDNNVQSVVLPKYEPTQFDQETAIDVNVPIVLKADDAKKLAEILLYSKIVYASQFEGDLPPRYLDIDPADVVTFDLNGKQVTVLVRSVTFGADRSVKFLASQEDPDIYNDTINLFGNVGTYSGSTIAALNTRVDPWLMTIPFISETDAESTDSNYLLYMTLLNLRATIPPDATLSIIINAGEQTIFAKAPTTFPTWGYVATPLNPVTSRYSTDEVSTLEIVLANTGPIGVPAAAASLATMIDNSFINLACVGDELIQFRDVTDLGGGRYRLTVLNRCLFGTDDKVATHVAGERFLLIGDSTGVYDSTSFLRANVDPKANGPRKAAQIFITSNNPWQPAPVNFYVGLNLRPFPVADFRYTWGSTDATITWERTARYGGDWIDGTEYVPATEPTESYDLYLYTNQTTFSPRDPTTYLRKVTLTSPSFVYTAAMQTADNFVRTTDTAYCMVTATGSVTGEEVGLARVIPIYPKE